MNTEKKKALITGLYGQDGTLLSEHLLSLDYEVVGIVRSDSAPNINYANQHLKAVKALQVDLLDQSKLSELIADFNPTEVYHLAACHHSSSKNSDLNLSQDSEMLQTNFEATKNLVHSILKAGNHSKFFFAGSSQMFTPTVRSEVVNEQTPYSPSTFYGETKVFSANLIQYYRKNYNLFGVTGILFNHESIFRGNNFISRYITHQVAQIKSGKKKELEVRNPFGLTDWSAASDFVKQFQASLCLESPSDYIFSSGTERTVKDIVDIALSTADLDPKILAYPKSAAPPATSLVGDSSKLLKATHLPHEVSFEALIKTMLAHDLKVIDAK